MKIGQNAPAQGKLLQCVAVVQQNVEKRSRGVLVLPPYIYYKFLLFLKLRNFHYIQIKYATKVPFFAKFRQVGGVLIFEYAPEYAPLLTGVYISKNL